MSVSLLPPFSSCSFLSSLLTAVLSHHLAWVFTVSRSSGETGRLIKSSSSKSVSGQYTVWPRFWPRPDFCCLSSWKVASFPCAWKMLTPIFRAPGSNGSWKAAVLAGACGGELGEWFYWVCCVAVLNSILSLIWSASLSLLRYSAELYRFL